MPPHPGNAVTDLTLGSSTKFRSEVVADVARLQVIASSLNSSESCYTKVPHRVALRGFYPSSDRTPGLQRELIAVATTVAEKSNVSANGLELNGHCNSWMYHPSRFLLAAPIAIETESLLLHNHDS